MKVTAKMLIAVGLLLAAVCVADGDKMLAKDGTPLPDGVARIVKWEASKHRTTRQFVTLDSDKAVRRAISGIPQDGTVYQLYAVDGGYSILVVTAKSDMVAFTYHCSPCAGNYRLVVIE